MALTFHILAHIFDIGKSHPTYKKFHKFHTCLLFKIIYVSSTIVPTAKTRLWIFFIMWQMCVRFSMSIRNPRSCNKDFGVLQGYTSQLISYSQVIVSAACIHLMYESHERMGLRTAAFLISAGRTWCILHPDNLYI